MRFGIDVGVGSDGNARLFPCSTRRLRDQEGFSGRLDIKEENIGIQRVLDFFRCLSGPVKNNAAAGTSDTKRAEELSAGDDFEADLPLREPAKNRQIGVGFDGITDPVRNLVERASEKLDLPPHRGFAVDINRGPNLPGDLIQRNILTIEAVADVGEALHATLYAKKIRGQRTLPLPPASYGGNEAL